MQVAASATAEVLRDLPTPLRSATRSLRNANTYPPPPPKRNQGIPQRCYGLARSRETDVFSRIKIRLIKHDVSRSASIARKKKKNVRRLLFSVVRNTRHYRRSEGMLLQNGIGITDKHESEVYRTEPHCSY